MRWVVFRALVRQHENGSTCGSCVPGFPYDCGCGGAVHAEAAARDGWAWFECDRCNVSGAVPLRVHARARVEATQPA